MAKNAGFHTAVETSGLLPQEHYLAVAGLVDCWLFGLRSDMPGAGARDGFGARADNLRVLSALPANIIIRKPLVSGITDTGEEVAATAKLMLECALSAIELLPLNPHTPHYYHALGRECPPAGLLVPDESAIADVCEQLTGHGFVVSIGR